MKKQLFVVYLVAVMGLLIAGVFLLAWILPYDMDYGVDMVFLDRKGVVIYGHKNQFYVQQGDLPQSLVDKIIHIEDRRFYSHLGVDPLAILRASYLNLISGEIVQGASTIDQQVVKLQEKAYQRSRSQKLWEVRVALQLNLKYGKDDILLTYLNTLEFPYSTQGLKSGCEQYFGKSCHQLSQSEEYFMIASYQLGANGFSVDDFESVKLRSQELCTSLEGDCSLILQQSPQTHHDLVGVEYEVPQLVVDWYFERFDQGWFSPYPTLESQPGVRLPFDFAQYQEIEQILSTSFPQRDKVQAKDCCVLVLDGEGEMLSMNNCRAWEDRESGKVNSCTAKRQTGSAMKPFLYVRAMQQLGLSPSDTIVDEEVQYVLDGGAIYAPKNFDLQYHGEVSLAVALASSLNIPAVKLLDQAGAEGYIPFISELRTSLGHNQELVENDAERFALDKQGLSLALGTYELSPREFAQMWKIFLRDMGQMEEYSQQRDQVADVLSTPRYRVLSFGQDNVLNLPGWIVKTGTSRHFVDGWTCGANRQLDRIVCVWMGNHDGRAMQTSGINTAGYLWRLVAERLGEVR